MRQLPLEYKNPIYVATLSLSEYLSPIFRKFRMTPNGITTLSLVFGLLAIWCLRHRTAGGVFWFGIWYLVQYFFDCMDGYYARKYQMTSKFGDWYDHLKDTFLYAVICYVLVTQYGLLKSPVSIILIVGLAILQYWYNGCLGVYRADPTESQGHSVMNVARNWCTYPTESGLKRLLSRLRWFGTSTCVINIWLVAIYLWYRS